MRLRKEEVEIRHEGNIYERVTFYEPYYQVKWFVRVFDNAFACHTLEEASIEEAFRLETEYSNLFKRQVQ